MQHSATKRERASESRVANVLDARFVENNLSKLHKTAPVTKLKFQEKAINVARSGKSS